MYSVPLFEKEGLGEIFLGLSTKAFKNPPQPNTERNDYCVRSYN